jgi:L-rhamnose isomerase
MELSNAYGRAMDDLLHCTKMSEETNVDQPETCADPIECVLISTVSLQALLNDRVALARQRDELQARMTEMLLENRRLKTEVNGPFGK